MDESVLCIPASACKFDGFSSDDKLFDDMILRGDLSFIPRSECEEDENFKQIVTYAVVMQGHNVFSYTRGQSGGEDRLKRKLSIGIGGHVSKDAFDNDGDLPTRPDLLRRDILWREARREINEEITLDYRNMNLIGLINDNSDHVGRVHIGLVFIINCEIGSRISSKESSICNGSMVDLRDEYRNIDMYESWSKILIKSMLSEK